MCGGSPTAGTWSSSQWRPDNEFETDRQLPDADGEPNEIPLSWVKHVEMKIHLNQPADEAKARWTKTEGNVSWDTALMGV